VPLSKPNVRKPPKSYASSCIADCGNLKKTSGSLFNQQVCGRENAYHPSCIRLTHTRHRVTATASRTTRTDRTEEFISTNKKRRGKCMEPTQQQRRRGFTRNLERGRFDARRSTLLRGTWTTAGCSQCPGRAPTLLLLLVWRHLKKTRGIRLSAGRGSDKSGIWVRRSHHGKVRPLQELRNQLKQRRPGCLRDRSMFKRRENSLVRGDR